MSDAEMAGRIRQDRIDVLIDLAGHTDNNRLMVFARKPAPVSLHWLDFGYTTGLAAIDYYLADESIIPAGTELLFAEKPWLVHNPSFVYRPTAGMGFVSPLPAQRCNFVTFGCLSRAVRINHHTIRVWSDILRRVDNSRLVLNSGSFKDPGMQQVFMKKFIDRAIDPARLSIGYDSPPWDILRDMDIGLDCFPHNSGTTLYESLYMGIPYITLAGRPSVGRLGACILTGAGHPEWIASTEEEYVELATRLASDLPGLARIRSGLRKQVQESPLMDEAGFARKMEEAYRTMFAKWCEEQQ
jgi:predicted O-linked N-acetylglucosamine transferase (SPINDLY family)